MEWVTLPDHKPFKEEDDISKKIKQENKEKSNISFFKVTTEEGVTMDGWMSDSQKILTVQKNIPLCFMYMANLLPQQ